MFTRYFRTSMSTILAPSPKVHPTCFLQPNSVLTHRTCFKNIVRAYICQMAASINQALSIALSADKELLPNYVMAIILVKGISFYGFHAGYSHFLKIYLSSPALVNKLVDIMQNGGIMGTQFECYESHIPFLQQFLIDYNLYGMDEIHTDKFRFRASIRCPFVRNDVRTMTLYTAESVDEALKWPPSSDLIRSSVCHLELDTWAINIVNRESVQERRTQALIDVDNGATKLDIQLVPSLRSIWEVSMVVHIHLQLIA